MKRLFFFGYAPAGKTAWPLAGLGAQLESLDPRHGVFTNLVTTPILSALCYLPPDHAWEMLEDVRANVLVAGADGRRRFNVLTAVIETGAAALDSKVKQLFTWQQDGARTVQENTEGTFRPGNDVGLVFNFWPVTALFSFLIQGREQWTKAPLEEFGKDLLRAVMTKIQEVLPKPKGLKGLLQTLPDSDQARLGLYFRLCTHGDWDKIASVLTPFIREQRRRWLEQSQAKTRDVEVSPEELNWVLGVLRSVVPHPHSEIYDRYHKEKKPIGKWQDCFMSCQDPDDLSKDGGRPLFWEYVGAAIAEKLLG